MAEAVIRAPQELKFPHLQYLILRLPRKRHSTLHAILRCTIGLLKNFSITVQEVTVEFSCYRGLHLLSSWLTKETNASLCKELESLMLRFALSAISFLSPQTIRASRREFWAGELGWYFPTLHRRGQIKILSKTIGESVCYSSPCTLLMTRVCCQRGPTVMTLPSPCSPFRRTGSGSRADPPIAR